MVRIDVHVQLVQHQLFSTFQNIYNVFLYLYKFNIQIKLNRLVLSTYEECRMQNAYRYIVSPPISWHIAGRDIWSHHYFHNTYSIPQKDDPIPLRPPTHYHKTLTVYITFRPPTHYNKMLTLCTTFRPPTHYHKKLTLYTTFRPPTPYHKRCLYTPPTGLNNTIGKRGWMAWYTWMRFIPRIVETSKYCTLIYYVYHPPLDPQTIPISYVASHVFTVFHCGISVASSKTITKCTNDHVELSCVGETCTIFVEVTEYGFPSNRKRCAYNKNDCTMNATKVWDLCHGQPSCSFNVVEGRADNCDQTSSAYIHMEYSCKCCK